MAMPSSRATTRVWVLCALVALGACRDIASPGPVPALRLSGDQVSDTIDAVLAKPLVIALRDSAGAPLSRLPVEISFPGYRLAQANGSPATVVDTADWFGVLSVRLRFNGVAGPARVRIRAPTLQLDTFASYLVLHGAPVRIAPEPRDTALYVGASLRLRGEMVDRGGNDTGALASLSTDQTAVEIGSDHTITARGIGHAWVRVSGAGATDTVGISVVPEGVVALWSFGGLAGQDTMGVAIMNLDGSRFHRLVDLGPTPNGYGYPDGLAPAWDPAGGRLVFTDLQHQLYVTDLNGASAQLLPADTVLTAAWDPSFSPDGAWIYFVGWHGTAITGIWRIRGDGTGLDLVVAADGFGVRWPVVSPDGSRLAYMAKEPSSDSYLCVLNLGTGATIHVGAPRATAPAWSPDGTRIAYVPAIIPSGGFAGPIRVVQADGTGDQQLVAGNFYEDLDWSPDGRYLLAKPEAEGQIDNRTQTPVLIDVASGERLALGFGWGGYGLRWRRPPAGAGP